MHELTAVPPRVVDYQDYHAFLRDFYLRKKAANPRFSYRAFAKLAGIRSSNFLMLVMQRRRKLSAEKARAVAKAMKLSKAETSYFVALAGLEGASGPREAGDLEKAKNRAIRAIVTRDVPAEKAEYLSHWYYPLVRELAFLPDFEPTGAWISDVMEGLISTEQATRAVHVMTSLGLWKTTPGGRLEVHELFLDTGGDERIFSRVKVTQIHRENLLAWARIVGKLRKEERELGLLNIPINEAKIPEFKRRIRAFQDEIIGWLQDEQNPTRVVQLGTYLVPVSRSSGPVGRA